MNSKQTGDIYLFCLKQGQIRIQTRCTIPHPKNSGWRSHLSAFPKEEWKAKIIHEGRQTGTRPEWKSSCTLGSTVLPTKLGQHKIKMRE